MAFKLVTFDKVAKFWPDAEPYIRKGCEYADGKMEPCDVLVDALSGKMQLWLVYNERHKICGAFATQVLDYHRQRRVIVAALGADNMDDVLNGFDTLREWAEKNKADGIEIIGRKGWLKVLDKLGFEPTHVLMRTKLWKNSTRM